MPQMAHTCLACLQQAGVRQGLHGFCGFTQIKTKIRENQFYPCDALSLSKGHQCSIKFVNKPG